MPGFQETDEKLFRLINGFGNQQPIVDVAMVVVSSHAFWLFALLAAFVFARVRRDRRQTLLLVVAVIAVGIADPLSAYVFKPLIGRLRPCHALPMVQLVNGSCGGQFGFPSNHAVNAGAVAAVLGWLVNGKNRLRVIGLAIVVALTVSFSRVWLGVHYPADVAAGLVFGGLTGSLVACLALKLDRRRQASSGKNSFFA